MMKLQFHIIGRADDITNLETVNLRSHAKFTDMALQRKVSWSENVMDERECPDQLSIGAADPDFCVLAALASFLESKLGSSNSNKFLFGEADDEDEPGHINSTHQRLLRTLWSKNPEMLQLLALTRGSLGSHSLRKFPATWCSEHGCSDREVEIRGRWKGQKNGRIANKHINVEQLPTDAKLAGMLAVGGPIMCKVKQESPVTHAFVEADLQRQARVSRCPAEASKMGDRPATSNSTFRLLGSEGQVGEKYEVNMQSRRALVTVGYW